jgi:hypothetical protein
MLSHLYSERSFGGTTVMRAMLPSASPNASLHCAKSVTLVALLLLHVWRPCLHQNST